MESIQQSEETHHAPEHLKKFFNNLSEFKEFLRKKSEETKNIHIKEIYDKFDIYFKSTKEKK